MRGRIALGERAIAGLRDQLAVAHDHATDRHLAGGRRGVGLVECELHEGMRGMPKPGHPGELCYPRRAASGKGNERQGQRTANPGERLAKVIARAGLASRREAEAWIAAGRVAVNGEAVVSPAINVTPRDRIAVDGRPLPPRERTRLFLYHKPRGLLTTHADPAGRPTIFTVLPEGLPRLVSVGRLDLNTEGLLLLTNDGGLARMLELPATGWLRRYRVRAHGRVAQDAARSAAPAASPSTASATARSRPRSIARRAAMSGSPSRCARARTAK